MAKKNQLIIGPARCMYPTLSQPKAFEGQPEEQAKYSIKILIPKSDKVVVKEIMDFVAEQVKESNLKPALAQQALKTAKDNGDAYNDNAILKDGDKLNERRLEEEKEPIEAYKDNYVLGLNRKGSFGRPGIFDENAEVVPEFAIQDTIKSGYWVKVQVGVYCYSKPKAGVTLQLKNVQFVKEDEIFGMSNPFDAIETSTEDETVEL